MHEQPNGKGDIESSFNHTGVHNCNLFVCTELGSLVTEMDLKGDTHKANKTFYTKDDNVTRPNCNSVMKINKPPPKLKYV